ncbi:MAG: hypothetical protein J6K19_11195 [Prevotella sp.]|nr:hypothetical protein [Prevotella sp.]
MAEQLYRHCIHLLYIVASVAVTLFSAACSSPQYRGELLAADSLSMSSPQKAIIFLDSMSSAMKSAPKHEQMYYELLRIKAADKAYIVHTSDSSILTVVKYYEKNDDKGMLPEAYYYAGSVYRDLNDAPQALEYYQKAESMLDSDDNRFLLSRIYGQEGFIYLTQYLYNLALDSYFKAYKLNKAQKDTVSIIYNLRDIAYIYGETNHKKKCIYFYGKALELSKEIDNKDLKAEVEAQMASFYIKLKEYDKAMKYLEEYLHKDNGIDRSPVCNMAAKIYMNKKQYDSAFKYCIELLDSGTIYAKQTASRFLTEIYMMRNDNENARKSLNIFNECTDSVNRITATESIARMNSLYNYNRHEKEILILRSESADRLNIILFLTALISIAAAAGAIIFIKVRQWQKEKINKMKRLKKMLFEQSHEYIAANKTKIAELENSIHDITKETLMLREQIEQQKSDLAFANEVAIKKQERASKLKIILQDTPIYQTLQKRIKTGKTVSTDEWNILDNTVNGMIENFHERIYEYYDISIRDYRICLLIRLGFSTSEMSNLLNYSHSAISKARQRLQEKFFNDDGSGKDFDRFINSL